MGSKKHKEKDREGKKKRKHRSRSRSRSKDRKRRHRDKSRASPLPPEDRRDRDRESGDFFPQKNVGYVEDQNREFADSNQVFDYQHGVSKDRNEGAASESFQQSQRHQVSGDGSILSIEETNRLRAKLGLKPLDVPSSKDEDGSKPKKSDGIHAPPINLGKKKKTDAIREKMSTLKSKREVENKLQKIKGLGDSDSDDEGASAWVAKSRKLQMDKELADKRAKMLEEMDQDFGIGNLMDQEFKKNTQTYSARDLSGLTVQHGLDKFGEGRNVILTLKDRGILDEDEEGDVLVNVNIEDDERAEKNVENKKKKPDYKPYDEPEYDEYGIMKASNLLEKYDEEIDGVKKESFTLDSGGHYNATQEKRMAEIRQQLRAQGQSLSLAAPVLATEYMTPEEMEAAKFKRVKKKVRKIRKKEIVKADDLLPLDPEESSAQNYGSRSRGRGMIKVEEEGEEGELMMEPSVGESAFSTDILLNAERLKLELKPETEDLDILEPDEDLTGVDVEEEEAQNELQSMLAKTRKLKLKKEKRPAMEFPGRNDPDGQLPSVKKKDATGVNIILNSTSEFCRNLGEIPTYGLAGNREEDRDELLDMELELMEQRRKEAEHEETTGGWNEVDIDENRVDIKIDETSVMEEEPIATDGIGAALKLALKKGYLEDENPKKLPSVSANYAELQAQNYTIQDKRYDDLDEKNRKRDRYSGGMVTDFREKETYKPEVRLDYVDESGRNLSQKEAFRQLSHRFHGKGSGKKKTEKRGKKVEEELLMKQMSSTDTPLNTLSLLQDKQRSEKSPFIVLSGSRGFTSNSIVKPS